MQTRAYADWSAGPDALQIQTTIRLLELDAMQKHIVGLIAERIADKWLEQHGERLLQLVGSEEALLAEVQANVKAKIAKAIFS